MKSRRARCFRIALKSIRKRKVSSLLIKRCCCCCVRNVIIKRWVGMFSRESRQLNAYHDDETRLERNEAQFQNFPFLGFLIKKRFKRALTTTTVTHTNCWPCNNQLSMWVIACAIFPSLQYVCRTFSFNTQQRQYLRQRQKCWKLSKKEKWKQIHWKQPWKLAKQTIRKAPRRKTLHLSALLSDFRDLTTQLILVRQNRASNLWHNRNE